MPATQRRPPVEAQTTAARRASSAPLIAILCMGDTSVRRRAGIDEAGIGIASGTYEIVGIPPLRIKTLPGATPARTQQ